MLISIAAQIVLWQRARIAYVSYKVFHYLSYSTRPLWDRPPPKLTLRLNYGVSALPAPAMCARYGWRARKGKVKVYDVFIFSIEMDLLELRIRELYDVVDHFIVLESDVMFTGNPKATVFSDYIKSAAQHNTTNRFAFAMHKISSHVWKGNPDPKSTFENERGLRAFADGVLAEHKLQRGDVFIATDIDEIPRRETVQLYRTCEGMPQRLNMKMDNYLYSFAWKVDNEYMRPSMIQLYQEGVTKFTHAVVTTETLADAGWHCSWCFPTISDFQFKMRAYSHADRHEVDKETFLSPQHIQQSICDGSDLYDMLPEAFTYAKFLTMLARNAEPVLSLRDLPLSLSLYDSFQWLRPGASCARALTARAELR